MPFVSREQQRAICRKKDAESQRVCREFTSKTNFDRLPEKAPKKGKKG